MTMDLRRNLVVALLASTLTSAFAPASSDNPSQRRLRKQVAHYTEPVRPLNKNEIDRLGRPFFGSDLDYEDIQVHDMTQARPDGLNHHPMEAIFDDIYVYDPDLYSDDYSAEDAFLQSALRHEMTHSWQRENNVGPLPHDAATTACYADAQCSGTMYRYTLDKRKKFLDYGIEQQAQMVQDFSLYQAILRDTLGTSGKREAPDWQCQINPAMPHNYLQLYNKLAAVLPLEQPLPATKLMKMDRASHEKPPCMVASLSAAPSPPLAAAMP